MRSGLLVLAALVALPLVGRGQCRDGRVLGPREQTATGGGHGGGAPCGPKSEPEASVVLPSIEQIRVTGALDSGLIREVVRRNRQQLRYCQERQLARLHGAVGQVVVSLEMSPKGAVTAAKVASSNTQNAELDGCIVERFRTWTFPKFKAAAPAKVDFPFELRGPPK